MAKFKVGDRVKPMIDILAMHYGIMDIVEVANNGVYCSGCKGKRLFFNISEIKKV